MKAKKILALVLCIFTAFVLLSISSSAEGETSICGHDASYSEPVTVHQTCTEVGYIRRICNYPVGDGICGRILKEEIIPAHNYASVYVSKPATCTESGSEVVFCNWCNSLDNRTIAPDLDNHKFGDWIVTTEATCKDEGVKIRYCTRSGCSASETASVPKDSSKHIPKAGTEQIDPPDCYEEGAKKYICSVCEELYSIPIPTHSDYVTNPDKYQLVEEKEANCAHPASKTYWCTDCATKFTVTIGTATDEHDYTDESLWVYSKDVSCKRPGKVVKYCKNSKYHKIEEVYAPHVFEGAEVITKAPKCSADGFTDGEKTVKCVYCDAVEKRVISDTHSFSDWNITKGNCVNGGKANRICDCGEIKEEITFSAGTHLNYDYDPDKVVYPTCIGNGYMEITCKLCGLDAKAFLPELDAKDAHTPGDWVVTRKATCDNSGVKELHCEYCDAIMKKEVIPQLSHSCIILKAGAPATCDTNGCTDYLYCTGCGITYPQEIIDALGHNFVEQITPEDGAVRICDRCYKYEIIGDDGVSVTCNCLCHNSNGLAKTIWKLLTFFMKIFGMNQECKCGIMHY